VVDHTLPTQLIAKINNIKYLALIMLSSLHFLSKNILSNRFATLFTYLLSFNKMFILPKFLACIHNTLYKMLLQNASNLDKRRFKTRHSAQGRALCRCEWCSLNFGSQTPKMKFWARMNFAWRITLTANLNIATPIMTVHNHRGPTTSINKSKMANGGHIEYFIKC